MTTEPQRWVGILAIAAAVGYSRAQIDILRTLTQPAIRFRLDPTSARRNRKLYDLGDTIRWLDYHLKMNPAQHARLDAAGIELLPSIREVA